MTDLHDHWCRHLCLSCDHPAKWDRTRGAYGPLCASCEAVQKAKQQRPSPKREREAGIRHLDALLGIDRPHVTLLLNPDERAILRGWSKAVNLHRGGFATFLAELHDLVQPNGSLRLETDQLERLRRYAFQYDDGGWQRAILNIFGRELGSDLDKHP